jgi:signal transduction histidine kinase
LGLLPALEGLLTNLEDHGMAVKLKISGDRRRLQPDAKLALFRVVQEALNNVERHAQASRVVIDVDFGDSRTKVTVRDDGCGFDLLPSTGDFALAGKFGLLGIEERALLLGGHFEVQSANGQGTTVMVDIPA